MPSTNGANGATGRDGNGRFAPGYKGGPGNPHARKVARLRAAMMKAVTADDVREIIAALVKSAKEGDAVAAREVLDRTIGKAAQTDVLQRLELLEQMFGDEVSISTRLDRLERAADGFGEVPIDAKPPSNSARLVVLPSGESPPVREPGDKRVWFVVPDNGRGPRPSEAIA